MRPASLSLAIVFIFVAAAPAFALQADDGMTAWKKATEAERARVLEQVLGKDQAGSATIKGCMNETSAIPGHADLPIAEVAKGCASKVDQPV